VSLCFIIVVHYYIALILVCFLHITKLHIDHKLFINITPQIIYYH